MRFQTGALLSIPRSITLTRIPSIICSSTRLVVVRSDLAKVLVTTVTSWPCSTQSRQNSYTRVPQEPFGVEKNWWK